tara:strand:- start:7314 stop:8765 length:1452 start_codon:yes stop_codon:yes gene_type:complete
MKLLPNFLELFKNSVSYKSIIVVILSIIIYIKFIKTDTTETFEDVYNDNINYIYWTGGFDSTFRICEMLINEHKTVQPLYITFNLDNSCKGLDCKNKLWLRRNKLQEINAMNNIRNKLFELFPNTVNLFLPTIYIEEDVGDTHFNQAFNHKFYSNNLWPKKRKVHQYYFLSKYADFNKIKIDTGVLGIHRNSKFYSYLNKNLIKVNNNWIIRNDYGPISYLNFPLFNRTKNMLYNKSQKYGYDVILNHTWSCWFPKKGKPCGKCPMCRERIISHPDNKTDIENNDNQNIKKDIVYLFWNGDDNSTFRLCQLLILEKTPVQTIYISNTNKYVLNNEISTMKKIRNKLITKYQYVKSLLLPTKHIKKIKIDKDINENLKTLYERQLLMKQTCYYREMAQLTRNYNKNIEVCIIKGDKLHNTVKNKLICNYGKCPINKRKIKKDLNNWYKPLSMFNYFIFPLYLLENNDIYTLARKNNFLDILQMI